MTLTAHIPHGAAVLAREEGTGIEIASFAPQTGQAAVNGLSMYYEVHGAGQPLLQLHGGFTTIDALGPLLPATSRP